MSAADELASLLNECDVQVTVTGWKAELQACEKERDEYRKKYETMVELNHSDLKIYHRERAALLNRIEVYRRAAHAGSLRARR